MDEDIKMSEQKFAGVEFQICTTDYHTWCYPIFVLEDSLKRGVTGLTKW